jgi:putative RNA 2'-phosphotransferase
MTPAERVRASKLVSLVLRHQPERIGLALDRGGWASVEELLARLPAHGVVLTRDELQELVDAPDKRRFALSEDGTRIRALQGHSLEVDLGLRPVPPPLQLYHGTVAGSVEDIRSQGLSRRSRQYVHLSADLETARRVAGRRRGPQVILVIEAARLHGDGGRFYLAENGVWLADEVPPAYIRFPGEGA